MLKSLIPVRPLGGLLLATAAVVGLSSLAQAATGFFNNIYIVAGNGTNTFYQASGTPDGFNPQLSSGWGTLNQDDAFQIKGFEINTWNNTGSSVTHMNMYWSTDDFITSNQLTLTPETSVSGNNKLWRLTTGTQSLLTNNDRGVLPNGSYTFKAYFEGYTNGVDTAGNIFESNGGANYSATFDVVPEPSTYALIALGTAFILWRIRRRLSTHSSE
jgi:hypothetical protein